MSLNEPKKLSGAQYKKLAKEKAARDKQYISSLPKLDTFILRKGIIYFQETKPLI